MLLFLTFPLEAKEKFTSETTEDLAPRLENFPRWVLWHEHGRRTMKNKRDQKISKLNPAFVVKKIFHLAIHNLVPTKIFRTKQT